LFLAVQRFGDIYETIKRYKDGYIILRGGNTAFRASDYVRVGGHSRKRKSENSYLFDKLKKGHKIKFSKKAGSITTNARRRTLAISNGIKLAKQYVNFGKPNDLAEKYLSKEDDLMIQGDGKAIKEVISSLKESYANGITDEFIKPMVVTDENQKPLATIQEGDIVICNNFRTDRCREITTALTQRDFPEIGMKKLNLHFVTMTNYDESFEGVEIVYAKEDIAQTLGEHLSKLGKTQVRIAETEKYPHVTFFFSGGREKEFEGEKRIMINSPKVATYDLQPEMSAREVTNAITSEMDENQPDFICLNFANGDMVGHTGIIPAIEKACITVDNCVKQVVEKGLEHHYSFVIIADHGNADHALNADGSPNTAHSLNPVPIVIIDEDVNSVKHGILADIAPTILAMMDLDIPKVMTGDVLV